MRLRKSIEMKNILIYRLSTVRLKKKLCMGNNSPAAATTIQEYLSMAFCQNICGSGCDQSIVVCSDLSLAGAVQLGARVSVAKVFAEAETNIRRGTKAQHLGSATWTA